MINPDSTNNGVIYWLAPQQLMYFGDNGIKPVEMSIACDPASWQGDYGCETEYKTLPDGSIEIVSVKYTAPCKRKGKKK